jgi:hypothetical protein
MSRRKAQTTEERLAVVLEWLYTEDGTYRNKSEWRKELVAHLYYLTRLPMPPSLLDIVNEELGGEIL